MAYILARLISWNVKFEKVDNLTVRVYGNFDEVDGGLMDYEDIETWIYEIKK